MNLASWSAWRLLAISAGWLLLIVIVSVAAVGVRLRQARDRVPGGPNEPWSRNIAIPLSARTLRRLGVVFFVPPLALTVIWLWQRFRDR